MAMPSVDELLSGPGFESMPASDALRHLGQLIDGSIESRREDALRRALDFSEILRPRLVDPVERATLDYFEGNAWSGLRSLVRPGGSVAWEWEQPELEKEMTCLRRAALSARLPGMPIGRACQIFTNLANALNTVGRFAEAIRYWDEALLLAPRFAMAIGNRAISIVEYGRSLYDAGHAAIFLKGAHEDLSELPPDAEPEAVSGFAAVRREIESLVTAEYLGRELSFGAAPLGETEAGRHYRQWCLENRLFLNPLNDLRPWGIAARDVLTLPSIVVAISEGPYYHGFFNQMKQEFVSARFLLYRGLTSDAPHFSDRDVLLYNTLDYPSYGLAIEKVKCAFRVAYSLFDKIAFFLNDYLQLGMPEKRVSFGGVWYRDGARSRGLRPCFEGRTNWPLRGLFWVSKDLFEDEAGFREAIEPAARELREIRHHLEHKYLKVHEDMWAGPPSGTDELTRALADTLAHSVRRKDFEEMTVTLLRMVRGSLIYLSLGIAAEERERARNRGSDAIVPPMPLHPIDDEWKR